MSGTRSIPSWRLTEITWAEEDALPFPLCLSAMGPAPSCEVIAEHQRRSRGNLVLVDHGRPVAEDLDPVPVKAIVEACGCDGTVKDTEIVAGRFAPVLKGVPLTFRDRLTADVSAARMLSQNVRQALPQVVLTAGGAAGTAPAQWMPQRDLLGSQNPDLHFVVEIDDDGRAHLRFGDDEMGQRPEAGTVFTAAYRVGNGPDGNVGAEAIAHLATGQHSVSGGVVSVRNPLPARGGSAPEPAQEAKLYAPHAFRQRLERAITAEDYAAIVRREFPTKVQRAAASLRWNGSWHEVLVVVDALGPGASRLGAVGGDHLAAATLSPDRTRPAGDVRAARAARHRAAGVRPRRLPAGACQAGVARRLRQSPVRQWPARLCSIPIA